MVTFDTPTPHVHLVPKHPAENVRYRAWVLEEARDNPTRQAQFRKMCREDILFYANTFCWTHSPKDHPEFPDRPFITWKFQDNVLKEIAAAIGHHDLALPKSREMGATWLCMLAIEWRWHFWPGQTFLVCSRKQEFVDKTGSPKALFWKLDYLHRNQPRWLLPTGRWLLDKDPKRLNNHLENADSGSVIDGEATVPNLGRGDRLTAILLDEHAHIEKGAAISKATRDATRCRIFNSTPNGTGGIGAEFNKYVNENEYCRVVRMHWRQHPEKVAGLYSSKNGKVVYLNKGYVYPEGYVFIHDGKTRSPWYDEQCRRVNSPRELAQEVEIDFLGSGDRFFDVPVVENHRRLHQQEPFYRGALRVKLKDLSAEWHEASHGDASLEKETEAKWCLRPMKIWCPIDPNTLQPHVSDFAVGCDVAAGGGGDYSSNSALAVLDKRTGRLVATFAANDIDPKIFVCFAIAVCKWFYNATLNWEDNGPTGTQFRKEVVRREYPYLFYRNVENLGFTKKTDKIGWCSSANIGPAELLGDLQRAMREGKAFVQDKATIDELLQYVWSGGKVVHDGALATEDESGKGKAHGDRAIAMGLAWLTRRDSPAPPKEEEGPKEYPVGSMGWILKKDEEARTRDAGGDEEWAWDVDGEEERAWDVAEAI